MNPVPYPGPRGLKIICLSSRPSIAIATPFLVSCIEGKKGEGYVRLMPMTQLLAIWTVSPSYFVKPDLIAQILQARISGFSRRSTSEVSGRQPVIL